MMMMMIHPPPTDDLGPLEKQHTCNNNYICITFHLLLACSQYLLS
jgi:hypothetical protein